MTKVDRGPHETRASKCRILLVDDVAESTDSLASLMVLMGYEVQVAYDGLQAVELAQAWHPEVVVLDISMPVMNGYQAAKQLRSMPQTRDVILLALTAQSSLSDQMCARALGFDEHLSKPVDADRLRAAVDHRVRLRNAGHSATPPGSS